MDVMAIGDTFGDLPQVTGSSDLFVHCGNFLPINTGDAVTDLMEQLEFMEDKFNPWLESIDAEIKIVIPGSNDYACAYASNDCEFFISATFIANDLFLIKKNLVYGMPYIPMSSLYSGSGVFIASSPKSFRRVVNKIHEDTNILITRVSPEDRTLKRKMNTLTKLKKHIFSDPDIPSSNISVNVCYLKKQEIQRFKV